MSRKDKSAGQEPQQARSTRITPVEIQQKEFRLAMRGYNERDVDRFLDELTEEVARLHAENKRLREQADVQRTTPIATGDAALADRVVRDARDEAERIVAEARSRAASFEANAAGAATPVATSAATPASGPLVTRFLSREREFLQSLAGLIQQHAESVKDDVRIVRGSAPPAVPAESSDSEPLAPQAVTGSNEGPVEAPTSGEASAEEPPSRTPDAAAGGWSNAARTRASEGTGPQERLTSDPGMHGQGQPAEETWATPTAEAAQPVDHFTTAA